MLGVPGASMCALSPKTTNEGKGKNLLKTPQMCIAIERHRSLLRAVICKSRELLKLMK